LAIKASDKDLLGYHDIRVGNDPDSRLVAFIHNNLPWSLPAARIAFDLTKHVLLQYAENALSYQELKAALPGVPDAEL
jgi:hypothetical protein